MGLLARQQAAYGVEGVEDLIPETEEQDKPRPTNNKKRQKVYTMEDVRYIWLISFLILVNLTI